PSNPTFLFPQSPESPHTRHSNRTNLHAPEQNYRVATDFNRSFRSDAIMKLSISFHTHVKFGGSHMQVQPWRRTFSLTLKNRLFLAFMALILLPFTMLFVYLFREIEEIMQQKIAERSNLQMVQLNQSLEEVMSIAFKTLGLLEQDTE